MKKIISLLVIMTLCLSAIPAGLVMAAETGTIYTDSIADAYTRTYGDQPYLSGNGKTNGTNGTFTYVLPQESGAKTDDWGAHVLYTYPANEISVGYALDKLEGMEIDKLYNVSVPTKRAGDYTSDKWGMVEVRFLVKSANDYFSILYDYANGKIWSVVKNNGTEDKKEIASSFEATAMYNNNISISGTSVSYSLVPDVEAETITGSFEVPNIDDLLQNATYIWQVVGKPSEWGYAVVFIGDSSVNCSVISAGSKREYTDSIVDAFATYENGKSNGVNGTFTYVLPEYCGTVNEGDANRIHAYPTNELSVGYALDKLEGVEIDKLYNVSVPTRRAGEAGTDTWGTMEVRFLVKSENDYFSILYDYVDGKIYSVVKNNGTEDKKEIASSFVANVKYDNNISISGTSVSYSLKADGATEAITGSFEVPNIDDLLQNATYIWQVAGKSSEWCYTACYVYASSVTCSVISVVSKREYSDSIKNAYESVYGTGNKSGDFSVDGTYGTYTYAPSAGWVQDSALCNYETHVMTVGYSLDKLDGVVLDKLYGASISFNKRIVDSASQTSMGIAELRYLYKSENDYFSFLLDYTNAKAYYVVKNNGVGTKQEISDFNNYFGPVTSVINISGTTVSYSLDLGSSIGTKKGSFEVSNIDDLLQNYVYLWNVKTQNNAWGATACDIADNYITCSVKKKAKVFEEDFENYTSENATMGVFTTYSENHEAKAVDNCVDLDNAEDKANDFVVAENDKSVWKISKFLTGEANNDMYIVRAFVDQTQHGSLEGSAQTNKNDNRLSMLRGYNYSAVNLYLKEDVRDIQKISFTISGEVRDALSAVRFMVGHGEKSAYEIGSLQDAKFFTGKRTGLWENSRLGYQAAAASNGMQATFDVVEDDAGAMSWNQWLGGAQYLAWFNVTVTMNDTGYEYLVTDSNGSVVFSGTYTDPSGTRLKPVKGEPVLQFVGYDHGGVVASIDDVKIWYESFIGTKATVNEEGNVEVTYSPFDIGESVSFVTVWMNDQNQVVATTTDLVEDTTSTSKTITIDAPAGATKATVYTWKGEAENVKPLYATGVNVNL